MTDTAPVLPASNEPTWSDRITAAADVAVALRDEIDKLDFALKTAKGKLTNLVKNELPALLAEGQTSVWANDDVSISIKSKVGGSLNYSKDKDGGLAWLRANEFSGIIKSSLEAAFADDQFDLAVSVAAMLADQFALKVEVDRAVHPQTLIAWAKARMEEGGVVPLELLGLTAWREADIKDV